MMNGTIEALIAVTLVGSLVVMAGSDRYAAKLATAWSLIPLVGSLGMWATYDATGNALLGGETAFTSRETWLALGPLPDIEWFVGLDGISMPLVVLTTVLVTLALVSAWTPIDERQSQFYGLVLFLEAGLLGVFSEIGRAHV